jgi:hypothetical protein
MAGGLHDHIALKAQVVAQREQLLLAGVARRVLALGRVGKLIAPGPKTWQCASTLPGGN